jgi:hypothetical protein
MKDRVEKIIAYQTQYWGSSLYEAIMAVADVCDLDNEELDALEMDLAFGPAAREMVFVPCFPLPEGK